MPTMPTSLIGLVFGRLTVISLARAELTVSAARVRNKYIWNCQCSCGGLAEVSTAELKRGDTKSCGCLRREVSAAKRLTHGETDSPEYIAWCAMKQRCRYTASRAYKDYGGRGIAICDEWSVFENFLADMGTKPSKDCSLDRKDNELGYNPENCKWSTRVEQARNTRRTVRLTLSGVTKSMPEWSEFTGISYYVIRSRLSRGWTIEKTLTTPVGR